jgi:hypothetical protein
LHSACHGIEQKLGDEMAYTPKKDEPVPSLGDKITWVDELILRMNALEWGVQREGGGMAGADVLIQALVALSGQTKEQMMEFLKPLSKADREAIRRTDVVKKKIDEIEAELAAKSGIDGNALLAKALGFGAAQAAANGHSEG